MIQKFVDRFIAGKDGMLADFKAKRPEDYADLFKRTVSIITNPDYGYGDDCPDPERIHKIDDGDYQGTLLFVVAAKECQPHDYWATKVSYGSCSGCDAFKRIGEYSDKPPTDEQAKQYWDLCLHMVQGLKKIGEE